jgi:hypothetical protein
LSIAKRLRGKESAVRPNFLHHLALCVVLVLAACGGSGARPPTAVHADFRELQAAEAVLSRGAAVAEDVVRDCAERCGGVMETDRGRAGACDIAERTDDADIDARCATATARARSVAARLHAECGCGEDT